MRTRGLSASDLGNFEQMLLGDRQPFGAHPEGHVEADGFEHGAGDGRGRLAGKDGSRKGDAEIFENRQVLEDGGMLKADGDAVGGGEIGRHVMDGLAAHAHRALAGLQRSGDDVHQRRLAGAVLAEKRVHFAGIEIDADVAQRRNAREILVDAGKADDRLAPSHLSRSVCCLCWSRHVLWSALGEEVPEGKALRVCHA